MSVSMFNNSNSTNINNSTISINIGAQFGSSKSMLEPNQRTRERKLCPLPVPSFVGQKRILDKMDRHFRSDVRFQRIFVLYGLGGSGKSQLAFKFLEDSQINNRFSDVFYVDASTKETIQTDLEGITPANIGPSVHASRRWLASQYNGNWAILFDNADDVELNLCQFFPPSRSGNILITTRNQDLLLVENAAYEQVTEMDEEDAKILLLHRSGTEETNENQALAAQLVKDLYYFALAVSQAGAFIRRQSTLSEYRDLYRRQRDNLLNNGQIQNSGLYGYAVYATWKLSYDKLDPPAKYFLQICSLLHHEGISEKIFERAALSEVQLLDSETQNKTTQLLNQLGKRGAKWDSWHFREIVRRLGSYSLIDYDRRNNTYTIHPLVQHWCRTIMSGSEDVTKRCIATIIGLSAPRISDDEAYRDRRALWKHVDEFLGEDGLDEIDPFIAAPIARICQEQGSFKNAETLEVVVLKKMKQLLGVDHLDTLTSMKNLANIYWWQSRWDEAEKLMVVALEKTKTLLGDNHPDTLKSMAGLAVIYLRQSQLDKAQVLQVAVLEKRKTLLGDDHLNTLRSMANLAATYSEQGQWNKAEELQVKVVEKARAVLGNDHRDTLTWMANLAIIYRGQSQWDKAEAIEVVVLEKRKMVLRDNHPDTLKSMANLADTYSKQGRWNKAEALELIVLEKRKVLLEDDHPDTLRSMKNLAAIYSNQGRIDEAMALSTIVEKRKRI